MAADELPKKKIRMAISLECFRKNGFKLVSLFKSIRRPAGWLAAKDYLAQVMPELAAFVLVQTFVFPKNV